MTIRHRTPSSAYSDGVERRGPLLLLGGAVLALVLLTVGAVPGVRSPDDGTVPWLDDLVQPLGHVLATAAAVWAAATSRGPARWGWGFVAAAIGVRTLALVYAILVLDRSLEQPGFAAATWGLAVLLLVGGLVALTRALRLPGSRVVLLDALMGALAAAAVASTVLLELVESRPVVGTAFAVMEIGLISAFVALVAGTHLHVSRALLVLGLGVVAFVATNGLLLEPLAAQRLQPGTALAPLTLASAVLIAAAPWVGSAPVTRRVGDEVDLHILRIMATICLGVLVAATMFPLPVTGVAFAVAGLLVGILRSRLTETINRGRASRAIAAKDEELLRFRALVEASGDFIALGTLEGEVLYLNPAARRLIGVAEEGPLPSMSIGQMLSPEAARHQREVERPQIMATGSWVGESTLLHRGGGEPVPVFKNTFLVRDEDGQPWLLGTIMRDITELRAAQAGLERFRSLVDASSDFIALADLDGTVRYVNPAGRQMVGLADDADVEATTIADYLTEEGLRASVEVEQPAVVAEGRWRGESTLRDLRGGPAVPVTINSFLVRHQQTGEPWLLATVQRDISELREAHRRVQQLADDRQLLLRHLVEAQEAERAKIAADVHDDPVQVMAAVDLQLGLVQRQIGAGADPSELTSLLEQMRLTVAQANDRLRFLLFDLDSPAQREEIGTALAEAAAHVLGDSVRSEVRCESGLELDETVRVLVYRIAKEAMVNVRKHAGAARVVLCLRRREGGVEMTITDDGVGMPVAAPEPRPGHRGLSDMRDRAAIAGGSVTWASGDGGGTEVRVWIPVSGHAD